ncbi:unnamed protein product [Ixodes hexagonus]
MSARFLILPVVAITLCYAEDANLRCPDADMKYIIDVDTGVDDAMALMMMTAYNKSIEAITVVAGNTNMENAYNNTMRVLQEINHTEIPVYKGADRPILGLWQPEEFYFGDDNFGNVAVNYTIGNNSANDSTFAPLEMIKLIRGSCGKITLIMLGPLTNLAIALLVDPYITQNVSEIFILGGNIEGRGNIKPGSEFNFLVDPEAAEVVLQRVQCNVTIVPWEAILKSTVPWEVYNITTEGRNKNAVFLKALANHTIVCCIHNGPGFRLGDMGATLAAIVPQSVQKMSTHRVAVELTGTHTKGMLVVGWEKYMITHVNRTVDIVEWFNQTAVIESFVTVFGNGSESVQAVLDQVTSTTTAPSQ